MPTSFRKRRQVRSAKNLHINIVVKDLTNKRNSTEVFDLLSELLPETYDFLGVEKINSRAHEHLIKANFSSEEDVHNFTRTFDIVKSKDLEILETNIF